VKKSWVVIGGAGFIGSHLVSKLLTEKNDVAVVDNLSSGTLNHIENFLSSADFEFHNFDVTDTKRLIGVLEGKDVVVHLASNPDIAKAATEPRIDFLQGTVLTESVAEASRITGIKTLIYASGSGVYLDQGEEILYEDSKLQPISTYGASKLSGEMLLSAYSHMFELRSIVVRFANVVGPKQTHGVGYDFLRKINLKEKSLNILGDGSQKKSYIYVLDVVNAILLVESKTDARFDTFNISNDGQMTVREIADMACEVVCGGNHEIDFFFGDSNRGWKGDVPIVKLSSEKIRKLGWTPEFNSHDAMRISLEAMKDELSR